MTNTEPRHRPESPTTEPAPPDVPIGAPPPIPPDVLAALVEYHRASEQVEMSRGVQRAVLQGRALGWAAFIAETMRVEMLSYALARKAAG